MKRKLLAVRPETMNYVSYYEVFAAASFEEAKRMIPEAERESAPFDDLDLPVDDEQRFWDFVAWMEERGRKYPFSVSRCSDADQFLRLRDAARSRGFHFNS